ncbi:HypC/HybG/HupF family hydrogenase formation chaperone [Vibrio mytili]
MASLSISENTMCLCIPSRVLSVDEDGMTAKVDTLGVCKEISTHLISDPVAVGDHLLVHVGFAISKINQQEAATNLATYEALLAEMEQEDVAVLLS